MLENKADLDPGSAISACLQPLFSLWSGLEVEVSSGFLPAFTAGVHAHREAVASLGLQGEPPADWEASTERLLDYRRTVASKLLEPMAAAFESHGPTAVIDRLFSESLNRAVSACVLLPAEATATWPEGALERRTSDRTGRRLGKLVARRLSSARNAGEERTIPLRALALRHVTKDVIPVLDGAAVASMLAWASWARSLELAWSAWGDTALPDLVRAELPGNAEAREVWERVSAAASAFQGRLEALLSEDPITEVAEGARGELAATRGALEADLAVAGSFLLGRIETPAKRELPRTKRAAASSKEWEAGVVARLQLYESLLSILSGATAVQHRLVYRVRDKCLSRAQDLAQASSQLEEIHRAARGSGDVRIREQLAALTAPVETALAPALQAIPEADLVDQAVKQVSDSAVEALLAVIRQAPTRLMLHELQAKPPSEVDKPQKRPLPLQELARQAFDALRIERIRSSTVGLIAEIDDVRSVVSGLPEVFSFAHGEARRELDEGGEGAEQRAMDLVSGAFGSMSESLRTQIEDLEAAVVEAQSRLASEIGDGSAALLDRVEAGRMEAQLLAARSRVADVWGWILERGGPPLKRVLAYLAAAGTRVWHGALRLLRMGSAAVVGAPAEDAVSTRTVRTLADADAVTKGLPLVYQRLFTLQPLTQETLMVGRSGELEGAMERWDLWKAGEGVPFVVRARQGGGITSFLNALITRIEAEGAKVARLTLDSRITHEPELSRLLATSLGVPDRTSLDELAAAVFAARQGAVPSAVSIDNLEHVYLRVPGGTDLCERLLTLMAETSPRVFWTGGVTTSAWQLVAAAEPTAVSQVDVHDLRPLGPDAIREAITVRHRRSGLEMRYQEPATGRHRMKRRLWRLRDGRRHRHLVEDDFFDQLNRVSDGHLSLALFHWLMSADFNSGEGVLMRHPERPDFSVLGTLSLTQNFTLKAFLEHRTLTLAEHDRIFRLPRHESYQVLESLRNRHLIEPVDPSRGRESRSEIEENLRYRLRPLLVGPVISHLRDRNIVH